MRLDELDIIRRIVKELPDPPAGFSKIGDDVALLPIPGRNIVMKSDMLVRRTDVPAGMTCRQAARKSVAMCVSDFAAKGAAPTAFTISLGIPRGMKAKDVGGLARGFVDAAAEWGLTLVGGDTNEADDLVIDCTMIGGAEDVVTRDGAAPGDLVVVTGEFGYPAAGLKIMMEGAKAGAEFRRRAVQSVTRPTPSLRVGIALSKFLSSSIDSSDGLAVCLHSIAEASGVGIRIDEIPVADDVVRFANENGFSVEELALYGGEEYLIVGTMRKKDIEKAKAAVRRVGGDIRVIGVTTEEKGSVFRVAGGRTREIERKGWVHLR